MTAEWALFWVLRLNAGVLLLALPCALLPFACAYIAKAPGFGKPRRQGGFDNAEPRSRPASVGASALLPAQVTRGSLGCWSRMAASTPVRYSSSTASHSLEPASACRGETLFA